ncbi:hypothetical protein FOA52_002679 [Chlamydomonas sp. UWO 241]|nr:hypothetical protein FOA52_002679 [Chlamydomonas sp. UWO 241]
MRVLLNLMQHGRPMTAYEQEKAVFKDEHTFSGLNYIKNDQRSRLGSGNSHDHLVWAMRMFISTLFTLDTFPYAAVIKEWREKRRVI